jgi:hypothetical protein
MDIGSRAENNTFEEKAMTLFRMIGASLTVVACLALSGCETTMSAKAGPDPMLSNSKGGACSHIQNSRSACEDQVGCYFDGASGQCNSH